MVKTGTHGIDLVSCDRLGLMDQGKGLDSWYRLRAVVETQTPGIDLDSWYRHGLMI